MVLFCGDEVKEIISGINQLGLKRNAKEDWDSVQLKRRKLSVVETNSNLDISISANNLKMIKARARRYSRKKGRMEKENIPSEDFLHIVEEGWNDIEGAVEDSMLDLVRRLEACKRRLVSWSRAAFPNFRKTIDQLRQKLSSYCVGVLTEEKLREVEELTRQIEDAWVKEETYWWQRS
ncbi:hypothetical protein K1719_010262 [Acacia pycnantha]|nr:hypothetical protein K1719_010262 [Acacia pycnantha]